MRRYSLVLAILLTMGLSACATLGGGPSPAQQAAIAQAQVLETRGDFQGAASIWLGLAHQVPAQADHYRLRAAEDWLNNQQPQRTQQLLQLINAQQLHGNDMARYNLLQGELAETAGHHQQALALASMLPATLPRALAIRRDRLRAQAATASGNTWAAAAARMQLDPLLLAPAKTENAARLLALLGRVGVQGLLHQATQLPAGDPLLPWIGQALQRLGSRLPSNMPQLNAPAGTLLAQGQHLEREGFQSYQQIGLLLPLSGPLSAAGKAVRDGFLAAYFQAGDHAGPRPMVRIYNTQGTTAGTLAAYQQALTEGADLIVGPLLRPAVDALFSQGEPAVPVLALNQPQSAIPSPANSAEFALMPESNGVYDAEYLLNHGIRQAIAFYASDSRSSRAAMAFQAQFEAGGGTVSAVQTLPVGSVDYAALIKAAAANLADNGGIFIAAPLEQARLLVPQIRVAQLNQLIVATPQVFSTRSNPGLDRDLDGVVFPDLPWLFNSQPGLPPRQELGRWSPEIRGPGARLFAFGMDAFSLSPYFSWLRTHPGSYIGGATGQLTVDATGQVQRTPVWARFDYGVAHTIAGGLTGNGRAEPRTH